MLLTRSFVSRLPTSPRPAIAVHRSLGEVTPLERPVTEGALLLRHNSQTWDNGSQSCENIFTSFATAGSRPPDSSRLLRLAIRHADCDYIQYPDDCAHSRRLPRRRLN